METKYIKGVGHIRGITISGRGRGAGLRGNTNRPVVVQVGQAAAAAAAVAAMDQRAGPEDLAGAPVGQTNGVVRGLPAGLTRHSARGTQRGKPLPNIPGETRQTKT